MSKFLLTVIVTFFAGMGAGLGTGFAGMSAAAVISPILITFLGMIRISQSELHCHQTCLPAPYQRTPMVRTRILISATDLS